MNRLRIEPESLIMDATEAIAAGQRLRKAYAAGTPFPSICIDNFFPDALLSRVIHDFPTNGTAMSASFDQAAEMKKKSFDPNKLGGYSLRVFQMLNSAAFLKFLEAMTGINGLIPDPYFLGGGFHELRNGGYLNIHADFNYHKHLRLERRVNTLIYLNRGWASEFGGQLEFWDSKMQHKVRAFDPIFNRFVVFSTSPVSYHGNPVPVSHPNGQPRRSIAMYYYTATWSSAKTSHTTVFHSRPGSSDRTPKNQWINKALANWTPPIMVRVARRLRKPRVRE